MPHPSRNDLMYGGTSEAQAAIRLLREVYNKKDTMDTPETLGTDSQGESKPATNLEETSQPGEVRIDGITHGDSDKTPKEGSDIADAPEPTPPVVTPAAEEAEVVPTLITKGELNKLIDDGKIDVDPVKGHVNNETGERYRTS